MALKTTITRLLLFIFVALAMLGALPAAVNERTPAAAIKDVPAGKPGASRGEVRLIYPEKSDLSPPLNQLAAGRQPTRFGIVLNQPTQSPPLAPPKPGTPAMPDPVTQTSMGTGDIPAPLQNWEGLDNVNLVLPPDTNGDVGPNHYVQMVNLSFAVFDKEGNLLLGPLDNNTLWSGFGGPCQEDNSGDPVVLYDPLADRWLLTQMAVTTGSHECFAVSQTSDPTGAYYRYAFNIGGFPDYPKVAVWPDAYYATYRNLESILNMQASAVNRAKMLAGDPTAELIVTSITDAMPVRAEGFLPVDLDGTATPAGAPGMFVGYVDGFSTAEDDRLAIFEMDVDWDNIANTQFAGPTFLQVASFDSDICAYERDCISQPDTERGLDTQSTKMMHRAAYRDFGFYQGLALSQSVDVDGADHTGVRWYELRNSGAGWGVFQQGTFAPDADHRWMPAIAMDQAGNLAVGYSVSSPTVYPSIRYAGRLVTDPLGQLGQGEGTIIDGSGSQTHGASRWGDYAAMAVDPVDECTFWFTTEYVETTGAWNWQTRIAAFKFAECPQPAADEFAVWGQPDVVDVCDGEEAAYDVSVFRIGAFGELVDLDALGVPSGYSATFDSDPVLPPERTVMRLLSSGPSPVGSYDVDITGTAGVGARSDGVLLNVHAAAPPPVLLVNPPDDAGGQPLQPVLHWEEIPGAAGYVVEVAADEAFNQLVDAGASDEGFWQVRALLELDSEYYWRVRAQNDCGEGDWSDVWRFIIVNPACPANTTSATIYAEDFNSGDGGWTHYAAVGADNWTLSDSRPSPLSGGDAFWTYDPAIAGDQALESPAIALPSDSAQMMLHFYNEQAVANPAGSGGCYDGGLLEISADGGSSWTQLDDQLLTDFYDGAGNNGPPAGIRLWCGTTGGFQPWLESIADISGFAGETVRFRYRLLSDVSGGAPGWWLDDFNLVACTDEVTDVALTRIEADPTTTLWPLAILMVVAAVMAAGLVLRRKTE